MTQHLSTRLLSNLTRNINITAREQDRRKTAAPSFQHDRRLQKTETQCFTVGIAMPKTRNGLGNLLFDYAGVMYVASYTGRTPLLLTWSHQTKLDQAFDLDIARMTSEQKQCPVKDYYQSGVYAKYAYNNAITRLIAVDANVALKLQGAFYGWKYTQPIEDQLRSKLQFRREVSAFVDKFLFTNVPAGWNSSTFVRVGVHVRRGDFLSGWAVKRGFTVASKHYLNRSMMYFVERYRRVQFIVASNDVGWCRKNIIFSSFDQKRVNVTFSVKHSTAQDLALIARCDHTVMTTGTYGWWASWLSKGITVYYKQFPRRGSSLWQEFSASDFYLPTWIGMD